MKHEQHMPMWIISIVAVVGIVMLVIAKGPMGPAAELGKQPTYTGAAYSIATMYPSPEGYSECSFFDTKEQLEAYGYDCLFGEGYTTRLLFESTDRSCSGLIQLVDKSRSLLRCEDQLIPELPCGTHEEGWAEPYAGDEKIQQNHGKYFGCR